MAARFPLSDLSTVDRKRFYDTTLAFMFVAAAALIGRTVGDALFLEHYSASDLAYMYPATAATVGIVAYGYARLASRWPLARLVSVLSLTIGSTCLLLCLFLAVQPNPLGRVAAYVLGDLVVNLPMILFWSFAAQCFVPGQAKRLFGLIGAGGTTACILAGLIVRPLTDMFGTASLLILISVLMIGFSLIIGRISRRDGIGRHAPESTSGDGGIGSLSSLLGHVQIRAIIGLMLAATVALTLVDYQFKAGTRINVAPQELASFFGTFYGAASAVALVIQLFIVHRVLQSGGVFAGLVILPAALVITSIFAWVTESFGWTVVTKFAVQVFAFTIDSAALQMLYLGIARQTRSQARALAEGIGKPLATGLTGLCLILVAQTSELHQLAITAACLSLAWVALTRLNHIAYIRSLVSSLSNKQFDASQETAALHDGVLESHIRENLDSANDEEVVYLLGILPTLEAVDWSAEYREMLQRNDPRIKIASLSYLKEYGTENDVPVISKLLGHTNAQIREGAIDAIYSLGESEHLIRIEDSLTDLAPETRAAAIAALINAEDLDGLLSAGAELKQMLTSSEPQDRVAAAHAMGRLERGGLVRPLIGLLQDEDTEVIRAALEACVCQNDPELIAAITPLLANPKVAPLAGDTLAEFGAAALDHLIPYVQLADEKGAFSGAQGIPPILSRIGDPRALPGLEKAARSLNPLLRSSAVRAYTQMVAALDRTKEKRSVLEQLALQELRESRANRARAHVASSHDDATILQAALTQVSDLHLSNSFLIIDTLTPSIKLMALHQSLKDEGEARNNAIEVLENVLKGDLRNEVLVTIRALAGEDLGDLEDSVASVLSEGCSNWVRIGALYAAGHQSVTPPDGLAEDLCHPHPVVRETALDALRTIAPNRAAIEAANLQNDEADIVRDLAREILETQAA